jgi:hypothetical protein
MDEKPKRRWFRFNLRTLFVVTTFVAIYLNWQTVVVHERKALLAESERFGLWWTDGKGSWWPIRSLMGDQSVAVLVITDNVSPKETDRLKRVFSEAEVVRLPLDIPIRPYHPRDSVDKRAETDDDTAAE